MDVQLYVETKERYAEIRKLLWLQPVSLVIKKCRLSWFGRNKHGMMPSVN